MTGPRHRQMHLGLFLLGTGSHIAGWRIPGATRTFQDIGAIQRTARQAEAAYFDLIFMGDNLYADPAAHPSYTLRLEPLTTLAAIAATTTHIGLGATVATTYSDPFTTARAFASLDHISHGRAAWNAVTGATPQGRPVILQAGGSGPGQRLAARTADLVFSVVQDLDEARDQYAAFKALLAVNHRPLGAAAILPGVMPVLGRTDREAHDHLAHLQSLVGETDALALLSDRLGTDMSAYDLDGPVPDLPQPDTYHSFARAMLAKARRDRLTLRGLYDLVAAARGHWVLCGSPETVADTLEHWFTAYAADGFNIMPPHLPAGLDDFTTQVVPILQDRGLFRRAYTGQTLRDHLNLPRPTQPLFTPAPSGGTLD